MTASGTSDVISEAGREPGELPSNPMIPSRLLDPVALPVSGGAMPPHTRAMIAAAAHAFVNGQKVAGLYDHAAGKHLRIAAEARGEHLQGFDDDRSARFGGTLPELRDVGDGAQVHMAIEGTTARGFDRGSSGAFTAEVRARLVQLYDHARGEWFAFDVQAA